MVLGNNLQSNLWAIRFNFFTVGLFMVYIYGLPYWSYLFNQKLGFWTELCDTPASEIRCGNGVNYTALAQELGRVVNGQLVGCSCGEGIFGDQACVVQQEGDLTSYTSGNFSISYFISSANATGAFAALAFFPLLFVWLYSPASNSSTALHLNAKTKGSGEPTSVNSLLLSQVVFQIFYGLFLMNTLCVFPWIHTYVVAGFVIAEIAHFLTIAMMMGVSTPEGKLIVGLCVTAVVVVISGQILSVTSAFAGTTVGLYAFWFGECTALSAVLLITPLLMLLCEKTSIPTTFEPLTSQP